MPSCYQIFDYWKDKRILENGEICDDGVEGKRVVENPSLACCWACGFPVKRSDILSWDKYDKEYKDLWSDKRVNSKLQKCHIKAKQFGGEDTVDNLFLLCSDCHCYSPDTENRAAFFRWVYRKKSRSYYGLDTETLFSEMKNEVKFRGYDWENMLWQLYVENSVDVGRLIDDGLQKCGCHGTSVVESTIAICIVDSLIAGLPGQSLSDCVGV